MDESLHAALAKLQAAGERTAGALELASKLLTNVLAKQEEPK